MLIVHREQCTEIFCCVCSKGFTRERPSGEPFTESERRTFDEAKRDGWRHPTFGWLVCSWCVS